MTKIVKNMNNSNNHPNIIPINKHAISASERKEMTSELVRFKKFIPI